jgi:hypothetical protein
MAVRIIPRPASVRGSLVHQVGDAQFAKFKGAACARNAAKALRNMYGGIVAVLSDKAQWIEYLRHERKTHCETRRTAKIITLRVQS